MRKRIAFLAALLALLAMQACAGAPAAADMPAAAQASTVPSTAAAAQTTAAASTTAAAQMSAAPQASAAAQTTAAPQASAVPSTTAASQTSAESQTTAAVQSTAPPVASAAPAGPGQEAQTDMEIVLTAAGRTLTVSWAENSSVDALRTLLGKGDITLDMSDYGGFEKGAPLPETLPENNEPMHTDAGDIILYQGRQFVIYYDKNDWSLTPLGKITGMTKAELQALLGSGNVTAVLSLSGRDAGA